MPRIQTSLPLLLLALLLPGCLRLQQVIEISKENKGRFKLEVSLPKEVVDAFVAKGDVRAATFFDPIKGAAYFAETDGFRITNYRVFDHKEEDGSTRKYIQVEGEMTDVRKALASGKLGRFEYVPKQDGPSRISLAFDLPRAAGKPQKLREAASGLKLYLKLDVPGKITETTAGKKQHGRSWASWTFNADADPSFLQTPPKISVTYK